MQTVFVQMKLSISAYCFDVRLCVSNCSKIAATKNVTQWMIFEKKENLFVGLNSISTYANINRTTNLGNRFIATVIVKAWCVYFRE